MAFAEHLDLLGEQLLQIGLDTVLDQSRIDAELMSGVVQDLMQRDHEHIVGLRVPHCPELRHTAGHLMLIGLGDARREQGGLIQLRGL